MHLYLKKMVAWLAAALSFIVLALPGMARADVVSEAEDWFNGISTMQADFIQVASDGTTASGVIHLRRPHQMKIVYDLEEPLILLTTRIWIHVDRPNDKTVTSYPISETPLSLILTDPVSLRPAGYETIVTERTGGITQIAINKDNGEGAGRLTLEFTNSPFVLRRWIVEDVAGVKTSVTLQNLAFGVPVANEEFRLPRYNQR